MADSRNFTALDWVTGEITETLTQAQQALESYVANQDDPAQLRFCLTYLHQVYSILQMVEFHGGSLLAEELEKLAQALVDQEVNNVNDAYEILMRAILQLPAYLDRVKNLRRDDPSYLLPLLNDLRAVRGGALLTESALFSPNMAPVREVSGSTVDLNDEQFLDAAKKLRQLYQVSLLNIIKEKDYDSNLPQLEKVFTNLEKICQGTAYQALWQVSLGLVEGLAEDTISAGVAVNNLLREVEKVIKALAADGKAALEQFNAEELIKNLLYYIAGSAGTTPRISKIKEIFQLENALPNAETGDGESSMAGVDPDAMRSVVVALTEEFAKIKEVFDRYVNEQEENNDALKKILPVFKQSGDTLAVLGQGELRKTVESIATELEQLANNDELVTGDGLMNMAAQLLEIEGTLNGRFNRDATDTDGAPPSMDVAMLTAQETVLFECQNGLEQAKDAIVEFIASQWDISHINPLPALLAEVRGSLEMVSQRRSARILGACSRYIQDKLIDGNHQPDWREMDTLADAIAGVEYYLETLDQDVVEEEDAILSVAEESVADLGYAVAAHKKGEAKEVEASEVDADVGADLQDLSSLDDLEEISMEEIEIPEEELDVESAADDEMVKRGSALTKEKLEQIVSGGDSEADEEAKKAAKRAEAEAKRVKREEAAAAAKVEDEGGPLLTDEEFEGVDTETVDLELETEFNFDALADNQETGEGETLELAPVDEAGGESSDAIEGDDLGVVDFESPHVEEVLETEEESIELELPEEASEQLLDEGAATEELEEEINLELPEAIEHAEELVERVADEGEAQPEVAAVEAGAVEEDEGELISDDFETDYDEEIAEIFIEEIEEVLENINEYYPKWKESDFKDDEAMTEFRRGFHTMKGSGRMAKALSVGELAWAVENMLNRVIDGTISPDKNVCELVERVVEKVPSMMEAYQKKEQDPDPRLSRRYRLIGEALSRGEAPLPFELGAAPAETPVVEAEPEAVEAPIAAAATESDVEPDWELWDIFVSEAESHLQVADEWIKEAKAQSPLPVDPTDPLQRAMHTLKGSAYMAELNAVGDMATPLEKFIKALRAFQLQVGDDFVDLLQDCVAEIYTALEQISQRQQISLPNAPALHQRINAMRLELTGESEEDVEAELSSTVTQAAPAVSTGVDLTLWDAFLSGDIDTLLDAADVLDLWQGDSSESTLAPLLVQLDNMSAAAGPAGLKPIASLSALMAKAYRKVLAESGLGQSELLPLVLNGHEVLVNYIDELAGGQDIHNNEKLESQLTEFIGEVQEEDAAPVAELVEQEPVEHVEEIELEIDAEPETATDTEEPLQAEPEVEAASVAEPVATEAPVFETVSPDDFDIELLEIFIEEAVDLLEELDEVIANWNDDPTDGSQADALKRILHTYKGGARMAGLSVLGTLAHDLETQLETFSGTADTELFNQINDYQDRLIKGTDRAKDLTSGESVNFDELAYFGDVAPAAEVAPTVEEAVAEEVPELEEIEIEEPTVADEPVIEEVEIEEPVVAEEPSAEKKPSAEEEPVVEEVAAEEIPVAAAEPVGEILEYSDDIDTDLLEIFIDEATELLEELDTSIAAWQDEPSDSSYVDALKRTLHTLKGGARMCGMSGLGTLAHDLETYLETFTGSGDDALFEMLHDYQDRIIRGVEQSQAIANGETPGAAPVAAEPEVAEAAETPVAEEPEIAETSTAAASTPAQEGDSAAILPFKAAAKPRGLDEQADKRAAAKAKDSGPQEMVKISAELVDQLVNLAGETSITRGRIEQQVTDFGLTLNDVEATIKRLQDQLRRMEIETEAQVQSKIEEMRTRQDDFDPLEMDHYSTLQQLTRSLMETSSDLIDLRSQLTNKARETEMILLQQSRINTELQEGLMRSRMVPFSRMVPRLRRIVRQVSGELKKEVDFDLVNVEGEMDRTVLERMVAPLEHMLRNALDHGVEMPADREKAGKPRRGRVVLSFGREAGDVVITLKDDGGGIPVDVIRKKAIERGLITEDMSLSEQEILQFIMHAGFSTKEQVSEISGRGVGMDVVASEIKQLGGTMTINSQVGQGTEFIVRLPFTVSVNRALMVRIGDDLFAVPLNSIEGIVRVSPFELENYYQDKDARFEYAGDLYEVRYLGALLHTKDRPNLEGLVLPESVILVRGQDHSVALHVDQLLGSREIVVKSLGPQFGSVPGLSGATILGDGSVVVILDPMALVRSSTLLESQTTFSIEGTVETEAEKDTITVMVVDDSVTVRKVTSRFLEREGFEVVLAKDGADAMLQLQDMTPPDVMLLDIEMPRMDGFEVATSVKNTERLKGIPIIMITSRTGDKHRERAMSIGVERYMGKPFVEEELLDTINQLLAEKMRQKASAK